MQLRRQVEEILEALWTAEEERLEASHDSLVSPHQTEPLLQTEEMKQAREEAEKTGLMASRGMVLTLTEEGRWMACEVVRRHRLAERLFNDILDVEQDEAESSACRFEHLLSSHATANICILLGHPLTCPHGKPIPLGECCRRRLEEARPLVLPASRLKLGEKATLAYLGSRVRDRLDRLTALGLVPGTAITLVQRRPSFLLCFGETELALDEAIVREIYVRRAVG